MRRRVYYYHRNVWAGCAECHGDEANWYGNNAQAVAARHHDATGHHTWVNVEMHIDYGENENIERHLATQKVPHETTSE